MKKIAFIALTSVLFSSNSFAQDVTSDYLNNLNTISTSVPFLLIAPDSRAGAMGDVGAATTPDHNSIHWNASKLAFLKEDNGFSMSYTPWLQDLVPEISLSYLSGFKRLNSRSTIAGSMRYFSLGEIQFTDGTGEPISKFSPNEFAVDGAYAMKLSENFSTGMAMRYIYSNLTGGINVQGGAATKPGTSFGVDLSSYYQSNEFEIEDKIAYWAAGMNVSNVGNKISYTDGGEEHFLPMNGRLGLNFNMELDDYNSVSFAFDVNKLLAPTPPVYAVDEDGNSIFDDNGDRVIEAGKNPNVGTLQGMFQSFSDAPGGMKEEFNELMFAAGMEYWYLKQFAFRGGYFHEHATKGNRKYFTVGVGLRMNVFSLDMAFLLPATQGTRSPLANTLRFTMLFDMAALYATDKE
tara:strand:+ start:35 stop:1252 length:1218 start_codon:yes stop_codon:yes gene_type:complete